MSLLRRNKKATEILFHHRMPTSTDNVRNACHPFSTKEHFEHNYVGVHNGVLWNEDELRKQHERMGIDYVSEQQDGAYNDSEALIYDIARYIEGQVDYLTAEGSIAFIVIQRDKSGKATALYFGRNEGNPLVMKHTKKSFTLSSEGEGDLILPNTMYRYDYDTGVISQKYCLIPSYRAGFAVTYSKNQRHGWGNGGWEDDLEDAFDLDDRGNLIPIETDHDHAKMLYVARLVESLVEEAGGDVFWALSMGRQKMKELQDIEDKLYNAVEVDVNATEQQEDEYYNASDNRYYMKEALKELEGRMSGQSQMGFRYTPDSGQTPHWQYGEDGSLKKLDEHGYPAYPYAS